jgi:RND family efflux transporter MFP subunit
MKDNREMDHNHEAPGAAPAPRRRWGWVAKGLLPVVLLVSGVFGAAYIKNTGPKARKRPPAQEAVRVRIEAVRPTAERVVLGAMGSVIPAREMTLEARVAGEVVEISPELAEGGLLKAGQAILRIDPKDYRLAVERKKSAVVSAEYALKLELGHQDVAKREWELLNQGRPADPLDLELALRKPHLEKARADLAAAKADLQQAQLDLERTRVTAPFNAVVRNESVEVGSQVAVQEKLAQLVGTDAYWIKASVPFDRLTWIDVPRKAGDPGSPARVIYGDQAEKPGRVIKLLGDLETEGRMARILIEVEDPLGLKATRGIAAPLLIGEYVRVEIDGRRLEDVFRIPRTALRDNDSIWIADSDNRLEIRGVDTVWRDDQAVLLRDGLSAGERLIVSDIPAPVEGLKLAIEPAQGDSGQLSETAGATENRG